MENVCWKTRPPNIANMLSIKHSSIVMMSASDNFWLESDFFYTFTKQDCPFRTQCICICFGLFLTPICFVGGSCCIYVICIYLRILVSNTISISDDKCRLTVTRRMSHGAGTANPSVAPEINPGFQWDQCCSISSFLCNALQIAVCPFCHISVWSLCCLFFFDLPRCSRRVGSLCLL